MKILQFNNKILTIFLILTLKKLEKLKIDLHHKLKGKIPIHSKM